MVALNQPTPSILFRFQVEKIPELLQVTTLNIQQSPGITYISFPYSFWKRAMDDL